MRRRDRQLSSFTLVEVVVALAILGLVFTTLVTLQAASYKDRKQAANLMLAIKLAEGKVNEFLSQNGGSPARREGAFPGFAGYSWQAATKEQQVTGGLQMDCIELSVTYPVPGGTDEFTVSVWLIPRQ